MLSALRRGSGTKGAPTTAPGKEKPILEGPLLHMEFAAGGKEVKWTARHVLIYGNARIEIYGKAGDVRAVKTAELTGDHFVADAAGFTHGWQISDFESVLYFASQSASEKTYWMHAVAGVVRRLMEPLDALPPQYAKVAMHRHSTAVHKGPDVPESTAPPPVPPRGEPPAISPRDSEPPAFVPEPQDTAPPAFVPEPQDTAPPAMPPRDAAEDLLSAQRDEAVAKAEREAALKDEAEAKAEREAALRDDAEAKAAREAALARHAEEEARVLEERCEGLETKVGGLEAEVEAARAETARLVETVESREAETRSVAAELEEVRRNAKVEEEKWSKALDAEREKLKRKIKDVEAEAARTEEALRAQISDLERAATRDAVAEKLRAEMTGLRRTAEAELEAERRLRADAEAKIDNQAATWTKALEKERERASVLGRKTKELEGEVARLRGAKDRVAELEKDRRELRGRIDAAEAAKRAAEKDGRDQAARREAIEAELEALKKKRDLFDDHCSQQQQQPAKAKAKPEPPPRQKQQQQQQQQPAKAKPEPSPRPKPEPPKRIPKQQDPPPAQREPPHLSTSENPSALEKTLVQETAKVWSRRAEAIAAEQKVNVFSKHYEGVHKPATKEAGYGTPAPGSLTEQRWEKGKAWVDTQIDNLIEVIRKIGVTQDGATIVTFGDLFYTYADISDSLVGILMRAKKRKRLYYEGDMLFQTKDDHVLITCPS